MTDFSLDGSVGDGTRNDPADVRALHLRLDELGFPDVPSADEPTDRTRRLVNLLQSIRKGEAAAIDGDGRVDVPGPTYDWLRARNAPTWTPIPAGDRDAGYAGPPFDAGLATGYVAETVRTAGARYRDRYLRHQASAAPLTVGAASSRPGDDPVDHDGHATGLAFDVHLPTFDGTATDRIDWRSDDYVRESMAAALEAVRLQPRVRRIRFNDPALVERGLCTEGDEAFDRLAHVEVQPLLPVVDYDESVDRLLDRAIAHFGGRAPDPDGFPATRDGFADYISEVGIEHFDADEFLDPYQPDEASDLGYDVLLPPRHWWPRGAATGLVADELRERTGEWIALRNWWRPRPYNAEVGGAENSDHITAHALDLDYPSAENRRVAQEHLRELDDAEPWLQLSLGFGLKTTHVGVLSCRRGRSWFYDSYPE